jgi:ABC-type lipoprotein release transport system permease subunit
MTLTIIAMAIGLPGAFALAGVLSSFLYGIRPHDTITFTIVPIFLAVVAFVACWVPALRATKINPQTALRYE